ncbi:HNH endonuclease family protein [Cellulomonas sp. ICMP 17802]|uniref:HNH endonuclease family protein n=1 Tax=Cellulomonas sp. ICMP 17802 TaxID=3239199 RepID=UPI00351AE40C
MDETSPAWRRPVPWLVALLVCVAVGAGVPAWSQARVAARYAVTADDLAAGRAALDRLPVRGPAPTTGYARERFGQAWADVDRNGCDTRNDVLRRDLAVTVVDGCVVLRGTLDDPYTGVPIPFARGPDSAAVQIDHVVALSDAWQTGAQAWTPARREAFANDPANLLAVDGPANQEKGAADAATWLPPNRGYRCVYALRQVRVKAAYGLWVTAPEHDALDRELGRCVVGTVRSP